MKVILSHPTGNANVRAVAKGLLETNNLVYFCTSIANYPDNIWNYLSKIGAFKEFNRRKFIKELEPFTRTSPSKELGRMIANKFNFKNLLQAENGFFSIEKIYENTDQLAAKLIEKTASIDKVYAYEDGALHSFREAKKRNVKCVYDLPIAYWETGRRLMVEEAFIRPDWAKTLAGGINDSQFKLDRKVEEFELADIVVVASNFVKNSLPDSAINKEIIFSPFGSPFVDISDYKSHNLKRPLRVLFVGSMGQRKGLADLFDAIKLVKSNNIELVVMGSLIESLDFYKSQLKNFIYEPPRPNQEVLALMRSCDVFCLPSIVEGRALVIQEAMSQGLPIIITPNTGGEDLVIENKTGFIVQPGNAQLIAEKIDWFLNNRNLLDEMSFAVKQHAMNYTWEKYAETIINGLM